MIIWLKVFSESFLQAISALRANLLRTFLSLIGIMIGIFCIIAVKASVDSLQQSIISGFNELGSDVIYLDKRPWNEDPNQNYWKYEKRPDPSYEDYEAIKAKSKLSQNTSFCIFTGGRTIKFQNNAISNAIIMGSTFEYMDIQNLKLHDGRYFTQLEYENGSPKIILGYKLYNELFGGIEGIGKNVRLFGQNFQVIAYLEEEGEGAFNFLNFDEVIWISYPTIKRFVNTKESGAVGQLLNIKAKDNVELEELKYELASILRASRRIKPLQDDNFALNELSLLTQVLESVFGAINIAGLIIGIFALIVGMFSVANIMFVSVKERTNIIGIKKALGAKRNIILTEFLIEAVVLCIMGGIIGLIFVFITLKGLSQVTPFEMSLSMSNILQGVLWSIAVGIIAGFIPAFQASKMDPVEAIRA
ncbi:MAG: ABC transporter permease [Saprospiraceae bacterium]